MLAFVLRLHNTSDYLFYPDSYQSLLVAHNIGTYHSLVGTLGEHGMAYPQFLEWTRPLYPLLISAVSTMMEPVAAGKIIALAASIMAVPVVGYVGWLATKRKLGCIAAMVLLAISYSHTVWSGFVMTESLAVLVGLLYLAAGLRLHVRKQRTTLDVLLFGLLAGVAVLVRYEYLLLAVLGLAYTTVSSKQKLYDGLLYAAPMIALIAVVLTVYPAPVQLSGAREQLLSITVPVLLLVAIDVAAYRYRAKLRGIVMLKDTRGIIVLMLMAVTAGLLYLPAFRDFMRHDFVVAVMACAGWVVLMLRKKYTLLLASLLPTIVLLFAYMTINQYMERYFTHVMPFLLLSAAYASVGLRDYIVRLPSKKKIMIAYALVVAAFAVQIMITYKGLHTYANNIWFTVGYEQHSAQKLKPYLRQDDMLIASLPEAYYFESRQPTRSLYAEFPFLEQNVPDGQSLVIVNDMGMQQVFPDFYNAVERLPKEYCIGEYKVGVPYRYAADVRPEQGRVYIYRISAHKLRAQVALDHTNR